MSWPDQNEFDLISFGGNASPKSTFSDFNLFLDPLLSASPEILKSNEVELLEQEIVGLKRKVGELQRKLSKTPMYATKEEIGIMLENVKKRLKLEQHSSSSAAAAPVKDNRGRKSDADRLKIKKQQQMLVFEQTEKQQTERWNEINQRQDQEFQEMKAEQTRLWKLKMMSVNEPSHELVPPPPPTKFKVGTSVQRHLSTKYPATSGKVHTIKTQHPYRYRYRTEKGSLSEWMDSPIPLKKGDVLNGGERVEKTDIRPRYMYKLQLPSLEITCTEIPEDELVAVI